MDFSKKDVAGVIFQYPDTTGNIYDPSSFIARAKEHGVWIKLLFFLVSNHQYLRLLSYVVQIFLLFAF
jgi:glycine cleavage system pyridoxal-binding protein P